MSVLHTILCGLNKTHSTSLEFYYSHSWLDKKHSYCV